MPEKTADDPHAGSAAAHRAGAPASVPCFVLTVSDTRRQETDDSGDAIAGLLEDAGHRVIGREIVRDEPADIARIVRREMGAGHARIIITTGGTGIAPRDTTAETLSSLFEKRIPGFGELFRMLSFQEIGAASMLSRATAGIAGHVAIFVLPGSEAAVRLAVTRLIAPEIGHLVRQIDKSI